MNFLKRPRKFLRDLGKVLPAVNSVSGTMGTCAAVVEDVETMMFHQVENAAVSSGSSFGCDEIPPILDHLSIPIPIPIPIREKQILNIVIIGPPCGGKGTQCVTIREEFGVIHLSTGKILRDAVEQETILGKVAKAYLDDTQLVPDEFIEGIVKTRLNAADVKEHGYLLDGFPRTAAQGRFLIEEELDPNVIIQLKVPDEEIIERVTGRRMDPVTGTIYNVKFRPITDEEVRKRVTIREDDTKEKIGIRLKAYYDNVAFIEELFPSRVLEIDGNKEMEAISEDVVESLNRFLENEFLRFKKE